MLAAFSHIFVADTKITFVYNFVALLKGKCNFQENFSFKQVPVKYVENIIKNIPNNKASKGEIPLHNLK